MVLSMGGRFCSHHIIGGQGSRNPGEQYSISDSFKATKNASIAINRSLVSVKRQGY